MLLELAEVWCDLEARSIALHCVHQFDSIEHDTMFSNHPQNATDASNFLVPLEYKARASEQGAKRKAQDEYVRQASNTPHNLSVFFPGHPLVPLPFIVHQVNQTGPLLQSLPERPAVILLSYFITPRRQLDPCLRTFVCMYSYPLLGCFQHREQGIGKPRLPGDIKFSEDCR